MPSELTLLFAVITAGLTVINLILTFVYRPWRESRKAVRQQKLDEHREQSRAIRLALEALLSGSAVEARNLVGIASREKPVSGAVIRRGSEVLGLTAIERRERMVSAAFTCMWYIELTQLRVSRVARSGDAVTRDAVSLYEHVDRMVAELDRMLRTWNLSIQAQSSIRSTNAALEALPTLRDELTGGVIEPTSVRLPLEFPLSKDAR